MWFILLILWTPIRQFPLLDYLYYTIKRVFVKSFAGVFRAARKALDSSIEIDIPDVVVASVNALQQVRPGKFAIYQFPYDAALLKKGIEDLADSLGV